MTDTTSNAFCVIGDLNARFGVLARELPERVELPDSVNYSYPYLPDDVRVPNDNALILSNICMETGMVLVNNLRTPTKHFCSDKTYRKGREWVSEIDTCTVSTNLVSDVSGFAVIKNDQLPSDHAPITVTLSVSGVDLDGLITRSQHLGNHAVLCQTHADKNISKKPIRIRDIDARLFESKLPHDMSTEYDSIDEFANNVMNTLYDCAATSKCVHYVQNNSNLGRWERLMEDKDDA